jgi:hypothetical protein
MWGAPQGQTRVRPRGSDPILRRQVAAWGQTRRATVCTHLSRKRKKASPFNDLGIEVDDVAALHFSILFKGLLGPYATCVNPVARRV